VNPILTLYQSLLHKLSTTISNDPMSRARSDSTPPAEDKRLRSSINNSTELKHYDIFYVPSNSSLLSDTTTLALTRSSFYVVNSGGLEEGLGVRYGLEFASSVVDGVETPVLIPSKEALNISRSPLFIANQAVCLGWVEENMVSEFEKIVLDYERASEALRQELSTRSFILSVAQRLEMEGICSNVDLTLRGHI
jgi:hypothetical protein